MAVLLSVRPKWCELIASGKKTIEVRKTKPKIRPPFKCYIYCTKPKTITKYVFKPEDYPEYMRPEKPVFCKVPDGSLPYCSVVNGNSKVIGEFICAETKCFTADYRSDEKQTARIAKQACLRIAELIDYQGELPCLYGWHISDLVIYDKPKELNEFYLKKKCNSCKRSGYESSACIYDEDCIVPVVITRPPQSWCYVQDLEG